jgi:outer membrane autotransporter protein
MLSGSTFQEAIAGTVQASSTTPIGAYGYYSHLHVTGNNQFVIAPNATLSPMLKNIFSSSEAGFSSPSFSPSIGQTFRAITADGGITGRFSTIIQPDGLANGTSFAVFYNVFGSNSIDLKVLPTSYVQWLGGSNANTRSAAGALDRILTLDQAGNASTAQDQLLYITASQSASDLPGFAKALAGEVHGALAAVQPQAGQWLQGSVARRLDTSTASGAASADVADLTHGNALWVDIGSNKASWSADSIASEFTSDRTQFSLGVDVLAQKDNRIGFGVSHANTNITADTGSGAVDETMGFVYGQIAYGRYLIDGLVGYGTSTTVSQRADPTGLSSTLNSSQDSRNALVSAGIRTSWDLNGTMLEPFARVMWQQTSRDGFSEGNAVAALSFTGYSVNGIRTLTGLSGYSKTKDPLAAPSTYQFSVAVGQDTGDLVHPAIQASLAGINTTIAAPEVGRTFLQANVSGTSRIDRQTYVYGSITGETRAGKSDLGLNVGLRMSF